MTPVQSAQSGDYSNGVGIGMPTARLDQFLSKNPPPTPFIVLDLDIVALGFAGGCYLFCR
jgi:hypothetical protein